MSVKKIALTLLALSITISFSFKFASKKTNSKYSCELSGSSNNCAQGDKQVVNIDQSR